MLVPFLPSKKQIQNLVARTSRIKGEKGHFIRGMKNDISVTKEATLLEGRTPACLDMPPLILMKLTAQATHYVPDAIAVNSESASFSTAAGYIAAIIDTEKTAGSATVSCRLGCRRCCRRKKRSAICP